MISLPEQLKDNRLRFIKVSKRGKIPIEKEWVTANNYRYNDIELLQHLAKGGNYGVVCGCGKLVVIDFDNENFQKMLERLLPKTFTVASGGKGLHHCYYFVNETFDKFPILVNESTVADVQCVGGMVVGPNSIHKSGNAYKVVRDIDIQHISIEDLKKVFGLKWKGQKPRRITQGKVILRKGRNNLIHENIKLSEIMKEIGMNTNSSPTKCPFHESNGNKNFSWDDDGGMWYCFHCTRKGNIIGLFSEFYTIEYKKAEKLLAERVITKDI